MDVSSSIRKRENNKYQAIIRAKVNGTWKQVKTKSGFEKKIQAKNWIAQNIKNYTIKKNHQDYTYQDLKEAFYKDTERRYQENEITHNTKLNYQRIAKQQTPQDNMFLQDITPHEMQKILQNYSKSMYRFVNVIFGYAVKNLEIIDKNPMRYTKITNTKRKVIEITPKTFEQIIKPLAQDQDEHLLLNLLYYTGMRRSEILGLSPKDITKEFINVNKQYDVKLKKYTKTKSKNGTRKIPTHPQIAKHIENINPQEERIIPTALIRQIQNKIKTLPPPYNNLTPHHFRHNFGSLLISKGIDYPTVAQILGDSLETIISVYIHPTTQGYQKAKDIILKL